MELEHHWRCVVCNEKLPRTRQDRYLPELHEEPDGSGSAATLHCPVDA